MTEKNCFYRNVKYWFVDRERGKKVTFDHISFAREYGADDIGKDLVSVFEHKLKINNVSYRSTW